MIVLPLDGLTAPLLDSISRARGHLAAGRRPASDSLSLRELSAWGADQDSTIAQAVSDSLAAKARADSVARADADRRGRIRAYYAVVLRTADSVLYAATTTTGAAAQIGLGSASSVRLSAMTFTAGHRLMQIYLTRYELATPPAGFETLHRQHAGNLRAMTESMSLVATALDTYSFDPTRALARARSGAAESIEAMRRALNSKEALDIAFERNGVATSPLHDR